MLVTKYDLNLELQVILMKLFRMTAYREISCIFLAKINVRAINVCEYSTKVISLVTFSLSHSSRTHLNYQQQHKTWPTAQIPK